MVKKLKEKITTTKMRFIRKLGKKTRMDRVKNKHFKKFLNQDSCKNYSTIREVCKLQEKQFNLFLPIFNVKIVQ